MKIIAQNRWQAFGIHVLISLALFLILTAIIVFFWYPGFLFLYDGGLQGVKLIAGVDFFIGPVLTLFVYKLGKKSLHLDLTCIAILQLACLAGGMWTVWQTRPIAIVYATGSFIVINKEGYHNEGVDFESVPIVKESRWPVWVGVPIADKKNYSGVDWTVMGYQLAFSPEKYVPYKDMTTFIKEDGLTYDMVAERLGAAINKEDFPEYIRFYLVITSLAEGFLAVDTRTGEVVKAFF